MELQRSVITQFHRSAGKRTVIWSLIVLEPERGHDGKTYLSQRHYDVEHSRRFGYLFHMSGSGGFPLKVDGLYHVSGNLNGDTVIEEPCQLVDSSDRPPWRSRKTRAIRERNRTRLIRLPKQFSGEPDMLAWLERNGIQSDAVFCATCRDYLPGDNAYDWCEHMAEGNLA
jgi:hypothetical protein